MKTITGIKSLALTCCAVGVLTSSGQAWAIDNCTQITAQAEADVDSIPNDQTDPDPAQTLANLLAANPPGTPNDSDSLHDDEDCAALAVQVLYDFGDAPDTYLTTSGAQQEVVSWMRLGATIDAEVAGQPGASADDDGADEDGVVVPTMTAGETSPNLTVTATSTDAAFVACWIDYDQSGVFDAAEYASASVPAGSTDEAIVLDFSGITVPANATTGSATDIDSYVRCRLSNVELAAGDAGLVVNDTTGIADGEVEDYPINFLPGAVFDLALDKKLIDGQATTVKAGDSVTYTITVHNQGAVDASDIIITDYIPTGMSMDPADPVNANWDVVGQVATLKAASALVIAANGDNSTVETATVDIKLTVDSATAVGDLVNNAEISSATGGTDIDSTPDTDNTDLVVTDNDITGDALTNPGVDDEDDHDPETITVAEADVFDLALDKKLATGQAPTVKAGDDVTFTMTVHNQGTADATGIIITDYIPAGMELNDANWTDNGDGTATLNTAIDLAANGESTVVETATVDIILTVKTDTAVGDQENRAEISAANGGFDIDGITPLVDVDSTSDADNLEPVVTDDVIDEDAKADVANDEDDHDLAVVTVSEADVFDLALDKKLATGQATTVKAGDDVTFTMTVHNQGTADATGIIITDYIPAGMELNDANWTDNGDGTATLNTAIDLAANGESTVVETATVDIILTVKTDTAVGDQENRAEISAANGGFDIDGITPLVDVDSTSDADNLEPVVTDDVIDEDAKADVANDEDDHDLAVVTVSEADVFDLALDKKLATGQATTVKAGDDVTFTMTVHNQGTADATGIIITDYIPAGMELNDANWTDNGDGTATLNTAIDLAANGESTVVETATVDIILTVKTDTAVGDQENRAEISAANGGFDIDGITPLVDVDSTSDADNLEPVVTDDVIDEDAKADVANDEDDHDLAVVTVSEADVFDLALDKKLATGQATTVKAGDDVTFTMTVHNQGTADATGIIITDYIPAGMELNDANWTDNGDGTATLNTAIDLAANGESTVVETATVDIILTVKTDTAVGDQENRAEISAANGGFDIDGITPLVDVDSTSDADNLEPVVTDDVIDEDAKADVANDEDDHDLAVVTVSEADVFDLALDKKLATGQATTVKAGDDVTFTMTVHNQGTADATGIIITDYIPAGMELNDANWTDNGDGTATLNTAIDLAANGESTVVETATVDIILTVKTDTAVGDQENRAEISAANGGFDIDGITPLVDVDSTSDADNLEPVVTDDVIDEDAKADVANDEDDHDLAVVTVSEADVFDLALDKKLATGQATTVKAGDDVTFTMTVHNQGTADATGIIITDYIPAGMELNDANWTDNGDGTATLNTAIDLAANGESTVVETATVDIILTVKTDTAVGDQENRAEISAANGGFDIDGITPLVDVDSTSDADNLEPVVTDDVIDEDAKADVANDEDDHDLAVVTVSEADVFDLALDKKLATGQATTVKAGDDVTFTMTVHNQGTADATGIIITDYIPAGMELNDANWTDNGDGTATLNTAIDLAANGESTVVETATVDIILTVKTDTAVGDQENRAEISAANGGFDIDGTTPLVDVDSTSDADNLEPVVTDDVIDEDAKADVANDEDDHDLAVVTVSEADVFDLALDKKLATGQATTVKAGDDVTFTMTVHNQGTADATGIIITDYIPAGMELNDANWTDNGDGTATLNTAIDLAANGESTVVETATVDIILTVKTDTAVGDQENRAEISAANGGFDIDGITPLVDVDSTSDADNLEPVVTDDVIDEDAKADVANDEDDHDLAVVTVSEADVFDLALDKKLATGQATTVKAGDDVTFTMTVHNQGTADATGIIITDYIPAGMELNDANWTDNGDGTATLNTAIDLAANGESTVVETATVDIILTVKTDTAVGDQENRAEISAANGGFDIDGTTPLVDVDSTSDADNLEPVVTDDVIDEDAKADVANDEDDHDLAVVTVSEADVFDLALDKKLATGQATTVKAGDDVTFTMTVHNQGTADATGIIITDYIPAGMELNDANWTDNGDGTATLNTAIDLAANGESTVVETATVDIILTVKTDTAVGDQENRAEISAANGGFDIDGITPLVDVDSTSDADNLEPVVTDDVIDEDAKADVANDEDDHDLAVVTVSEADVFDLALDKKLATGQATTVKAGDDVTFTMTVHNQGTADATGIIITDYIPAGMELNDANWTDNGDGTATLNTAIDLAANGESTVVETATVDIILTVKTDTAVGDQENRAEISAANGGFDIDGTTPLVDVDSTPDADNLEPVVTDDVIDEDAKADVANDEDDHDLAVVTVSEADVFDLALDKKLATGQATTVKAGDDVTFTMTVHNQGTADATGIIITDYIPAGMELNDANWTDNGDGTATLNTAIDLAANGESTVVETATVDIILTVKTDTAVGDQENRAEISAANGGFDIDGTTPLVDVDSTPDADNLEPVVTDDVIDEDAKADVANDEDDHDLAVVTVSEADVFDLALDKKLATGQATTVKAGDDVTFTMTVHNQGTADATGIIITDYIPAGMELNDANWTDNGDGTATLNTAIDLAANGESTVVETATVDIILTVKTDTAVGDQENRAEISAANGGFDIDGITPLVDVDSTPDADNLEPVVTDDVIDEDAKADVANDEDDHDLAVVTVSEADVFDLALDKKLATGQATTVKAGDDVTFTMTVHNQGTADATGIIITDYIPAGMELNDANWTDNGDGTATLNTAIDLAANGESTVVETATVDIILTVKTDTAVGDQENRAEISAANGGFDIDGTTPLVDVDSTPDADNLEPVVTDDVIDEDAKADVANDEDDHDLAVVTVSEADVFDLALDKKLATGQATTVKAGDDVTFTMTVHNQGTADATGIIITDYIPAGMELNDANWTDNGDGTATLNTAIDLAANGESTVVETATVDIILTVKTDTAVGDQENRAEISAANGGFDIDGITPLVDVDSTPDADNLEPVVTDDVIDEDAKADVANDEDDHDLAVVTVSEADVFDLALDKKLATGQATTVKAGDDVTFTMTVHNQGTADATGIIITDYIPAGMELNDANWTDNGDGTATLNTAIDLAANGESTVVETATVDIILTVKTDTAIGDQENRAEISAANGGFDIDGTTPLVDVDSTSDADNLEPVVTDDVIDEDAKADVANDEDDHDLAVVAVVEPEVDIELTKQVLNKQATATITEAKRGDQVVYELTVTNQGPDNATLVTVVDLLPDGVAYDEDNASMVTDSTGAATSYDSATGEWMIGTINVGDTVVLQIVVTIE